MRLFTYPRPTIAAINGHTFAGGLVTAGVCDRRISVDRDARFALNEVLIGIPMPAVYVRMLGLAWGEKVSARVSLFGEVFDTQQSLDPDIEDLADPLDDELPRWFTTDGARHAHRRYWTELKGTDPIW